MQSTYVLVVIMSWTRTLCSCIHLAHNTTSHIFFQLFEVHFNNHEFSATSRRWTSQEQHEASAIGKLLKDLSRDSRSGDTSEKVAILKHAGRKRRRGRALHCPGTGARWRQVLRSWHLNIKRVFVVGKHSKVLSFCYKKRTCLPIVPRNAPRAARPKRHPYTSTKAKSKRVYTHSPTHFHSTKIFRTLRSRQKLWNSFIRVFMCTVHTLVQTRERLQTILKNIGRVHYLKAEFGLSLPLADTFGLCSYGMRTNPRARSCCWTWVTKHLDQHAETHAQNWVCVESICGNSRIYRLNESKHGVVERRIMPFVDPTTSKQPNVQYNSLV
jgi:hypothetical protein